MGRARHDQPRADAGGRRAAARRACLGLALSTCALLAPERALAQDTSSGEPTFNPTPSTAPAANDQSNKLLGPIERLPASAYPSEPIRGIYGGSLWMTFAGLQWPYYPKTGIGVSGYVWLDTGYEHIARGSGSPTDPSISYLVQQGRLVFRLTPTWSDGQWFVQGQSEFVGNQNQSEAPPVQSDVDDLWVKAGLWNVFDVQVGRFQGWEIYHFGMGLDLYTLERNGATDNSPNLPYPAIYGVTTEMYYPQSVGQGALHLYPTSWLRFEVQGRYGNENGLNTVGTRPVAILDFGWMKFKMGAEYQHQAPQTSSAQLTINKGAGAALQFIADPYVEFGVNGAYGIQNETNADASQNLQGSTWTYSVGAFANVRLVGDLLLGGGLNYTYLQDRQYDPALGRYEDFDQWQGFGALQYLLFKQLYIKGVVGYALADFNPNRGATTFANRMISGRLRLEYLF